jgi:DNA-binding IclR family transcriptional regulator
VEKTLTTQIDTDAEITEAGNEDRNFVTALARGLDVLSSFKRGEAFLGNHDIAERCDLPRSTVSRLTYTLTKLGYLNYVEETGKYRHGASLIGLSSLTLSGLNIRSLARDGMKELAKFSNATVGLGVRDRLSMRYVECCHGSAAILLNVDTGSRMSLTRSAMGRAYLAVCSETERHNLFDELRGLDEVTWPRLKATLDRAIEDYHANGYASSFGDWQESVSGIAIAFNPGGGMAPMVLNCGAPSVITPPEFLIAEALPRLIALTQSLEGAAGS